MVTYLDDDDILPGLQEVDRRKLRGAFDCLFDYYRYKDQLHIVNQQQRESMRMFVFNDDQQYVAHIQFSSTARRNLANQFTVNATLTCQRYTYFPFQQSDIADVMRALENLHVA